MEISYDKEADAVYIKLKSGKFSENKKVNDLTILDLDEKGEILGIEILDASKRIPKESLSRVVVSGISLLK
tara:strand:- start:443 stop:655 length:213 start_codon:yes stop_codon:yes gene_type:complete